MKKAQIEPALLENPNQRITATQMEWLSEAAMRELDDEALGWFSRRLPWGCYGMLARASLGSPNLGVALKRWCRHHQLLTDEVLIELEVSGTQAQLQIQTRRHLGVAEEFCIVSLFRNLLGLACWLIDSRIPLRRTELGFAPPAHHDSYSVLFEGPCHFNAPAHQISFDAGYLALPIRRDDAALRRMLERALLLMVRHYKRDRLRDGQLAERVRQVLAVESQDLRCAEDLAQRLNLSTRSLHRHLKAEGTSLQRIKDEARKDNAQALLERSRKPIKHVALSVGFQNEKSFARAFKQWTGLSPEAYRQRCG